MEYFKFALYIFVIPLAIVLPVLAIQAHYMVRMSTACGICGAKRVPLHNLGLPIQTGPQ